MVDSSSTEAAAEAVTSQFPSNSTLPFWRTEPHPLDSHRSTDSIPSEVDVVVIGAGYAGISTIYHLLQQPDQRSQSKPSILILEAREICSGASGRNGGHVKPDVYFNLTKYSKKFGVEAATEFAKFEAANVTAVKNVVEKESIDCDFVLTRAMDVYLDERQAEVVEKEWREVQRLGKASLGEVQFIKGCSAERVSMSIYCFSCE